MKKILLLLITAASFLSGYAQPTYTKISQKYAWLGGAMDSGFHMPRYSLPPYNRLGVSTQAGNIGLDTILHRPWYYSGSVWRRFGTVYNVEVGNLSPLFSSGVSDPTGGVSVSFALSNTTQYTVFGRLASGSGAPSYIGIDTTFISNFNIKVRSLISLTTTGTGAATYNSTTGAFNIPTPTLSTYYNTNAGSGYRLAYPNTNNIRTLFGSGILVIDSTTNASALTLTATEVDGSVSNELQTLANTSDATTHTTTLSNSGGSTQLVEGSGITIATTGTTLNGIATITAVDPSLTNEIQTISAGGSTAPTIDLSIGGGTVTLNGAGNVSLSRSSNTITITGAAPTGAALTKTDDTNVTLTLGGSPTTALLAATSLTLGWTGDLAFSRITQLASQRLAGNSTGGTADIQEISLGAGLSWSSTSIVATDPSLTNELQTINNTSDATSHTVTLSNSGGSVQLIEGTAITLTTGGSGYAGTLTIASTGVVNVTATDANGFDFDMTGTTTRNIALTTTLTAGSVFFAGSGGAINEDNNDLFFDNTNDYLGVGMGSPGVTLDVYRNDVEVYVARFVNEGGDGVYISGTGSSLLEVDNGSTPLFAVNSTGSIGFNNLTGTSGHILKSNGSSASPTWVAASTLFTEAQTLTVGGTTQPTITLSGTSSVVTLTAAGIVQLNNFGLNEIGITATEVDGSTTNEIQTVTGTSNRISVSGGGGMTPTVDISGSYVGQSSITTLGTITTGVWNGTDVAFANIAQVSGLAGNTSTGDIGSISLGSGLSFSGSSLVATDNSATNEIQTFSVSTDGSSTLTWTLASGGSLTLTAGTGIFFSAGGSGGDASVTINLVTQPSPKPIAKPKP